MKIKSRFIKSSRTKVLHPILGPLISVDRSWEVHDQLSGLDLVLIRDQFQCFLKRFFEKSSKGG